MSTTIEITAAGHEKDLLGSILLDSTVLDLLGDTVTATDFADKALGNAYALLQDLHAAGEPVADIGFVARKLADTGLLAGIGGHAGLAKMTMDVGHAHNAPFYASEIRRASGLRKLTRLAAMIADEAGDPAADPADIAARIDNAARAIANRSSVTRAVTLAEAAANALAAIDAVRQSGKGRSLPTGLWRLDETFGGFFPGEVTILAARPSVGKSALGSQIGLHNADQGRQVMFVSLEMKAEDIALRSMADHVGVPMRELRAGRINEQERQTAGRFVANIAGLPFQIWSDRNATVRKLRAAAKVRRASTGLDLLVLDYVGLVAGSDRRQKKWEQISEVSGDLKSLAMEMDLPILALCQLAREVEKGGSPRLDHLRDSGSLEQDADSVLLLHRQSKEATSATLDIAKARNGPTGGLTLGFDPERLRFADTPEWEP